MTQFLLHTTILAGITLFPVLGYNVVFGKGKILHFGQEAFSIIAAYALWVPLMRYGYAFIPSLALCIAATALCALFFAWLSFRLDPDGLGVLSIAVHLAVLAVVLNWQSVTRGALGIPRVPRLFLPASTEAFAALVIVLVLLWITALVLLDRSSFGRGMAALSEHEWHAESLGVSRRKLHTIAFLIAGFGSVVSAILFPPYIHLLSPGNYNFPVMIFFIMCVLAGGPGRVLGVTVSTIVLVFLREGLRFVDLPPDILGPVRLLLYGVILSAVVFLRRDRLFPKQRDV